MAKRWVTSPRPLRDFAVQAARERLGQLEPRAVTLAAPDGTPLFIDISTPPPVLVLYGAGHDAMPSRAGRTIWATRCM